MIEIFVSSNNKDKFEEIKEILENYKIISMKEAGINIDIEENEETFEKNAIVKAEAIAKKLNGKMCIADDSGIEIEYLKGFPGVLTKRWHKGTDRERNLKLIEKLKGVQGQKRKVTFTVSIALSDGEKTVCKTGKINGFIAEMVKGENGFGFDEIFELETGKTLAELTKEEKNKISARKIALKKLKELIGKGE